MGFLTTHVLDTATGKPAEAMKIQLYKLEGKDRALIKSVVTNADGRVDSPILPEAEFSAGIFELVFFAGDYLRASSSELPSPLFLDEIPIRFGMADASAHYHVPLLISPFGYSTYRGS